MATQASGVKGVTASPSRLQCWVESLALGLGIPSAIWAVSRLISLSIPAAVHGSPETFKSLLFFAAKNHIDSEGTRTGVLQFLQQAARWLGKPKQWAGTY